jgi:CDGSH-type Zn-finger protein
MRIIIHERTGPYRVKIRDIEGAEKVDSNSKLLEFEVEFCGCGLSNNKPFCDGSHEMTEDEDLSTVYAYDENHQRIVASKFYRPNENL